MIKLKENKNLPQIREKSWKFIGQELWKLKLSWEMLGVLFSFICLLLSSVISFHLLHLWSPFLTLSSLLCYSLHIVSCFFCSSTLTFFHPCLSHLVSSCLSSLPSYLLSTCLTFIHFLSLLFTQHFIYISCLYPVSSCICLVLSLFLSYHYFVCYHLVSCWSPLLTFFNPCFFSLLSTFLISFPL